MKSFNKIIAAAMVLIAAPYVSTAQSDKSMNVVTTAVPFLSISPDARAGGMGEAGIAADPDANAAFRNLAKTPFTESRSGIGATYSPWLRKLGLNDTYLATLSGYAKLDENQAISSSLRYFRMGNINFTDYMGNQLGSFRPREFSIDAGYSRKLSDRMGLAIALRYINSNLIGGRTIGQTTYKTGSAVAGDLSLYYNAQNVDGQGWSFGAAMTNIGSKIGYTADASQRDFIPANLGIGVAYTRVYDEQNKISFGLDINKLMVPTPPVSGDSMAWVNYRNKSVVNGLFSSFGDAPGGFSEELKEFQIGGGLEYTYNNQFAARAGYFHENKTKGNRQYFTIGAGIRYTVAGINFSYIIPSGSGISENPLSNTLRFSAVLDIQ